MLHVTHQNGETALYYEWEWVYTCGWMSDNGEYHTDESKGRAKEAIKPGVYVLDAVPLTDAVRPPMQARPVVLSPVAAVRVL